jgi:hypothetical protein
MIERGEQVQFMGEIYAASMRTTVWLGTESEYSSLAFEFMILSGEQKHLSTVCTASDALAEKWRDLEDLRVMAFKIHREVLDLQGKSLTDSNILNLDAVEDPILEDAYPEYFTKQLLLLEERQVQIALTEEVGKGGSRHARVPKTLSLLEKSLELASTRGKTTRHAIERKSALLAARVSTLCGPEITPEEFPGPPSPVSVGENSHSDAIHDRLLIPRLSRDRYEKAYVGWRDILRRAWWKRVWVVQEIAMSSAVVFQCGNSVALWDDVYASINFKPILYFPREMPEIFNLLDLRKELDDKKAAELVRRDENLLLKLLQRFRYCRATDSLDKVYALLHLAVDFDDDNFKIDYGRTPGELYTDLAATCIKRHHSLNVFGYLLTQDEDGLEALPSWVPDWSAATRAHPFHDGTFLGNQWRDFYGATGGSEVCGSVSRDANILLVTGFVFDTAEVIWRTARDLLALFGRGADRYRTKQQHLTIVQDWENEALESSKKVDPYQPQSSRLEAFWRTVIADAIDGERATDEVVEMFNVWSGRAGSVDEDFTEPFVSALHRASNHRKFCISEKGYMALVPAETEAGDLICLLLGGQMPFVLRQRGDEFCILGACYVHGIMDGEAMEQAEGGIFETRKFILV